MQPLRSNLVRSTISSIPSYHAANSLTILASKFPEPQSEDTVTILRTDYENLVRTAQNHAELCRCLINAPIENVEVVQALNACLSSQQAQYPSTVLNQHVYNANAPSFEPASYSDASPDFDSSSIATSPSSFISHGARLGIYPFPPPRSLSGSQREATFDMLDHSLSSFNLFEEPSFRSVQLLNIPEDATYADITAVVRGGILFDISIMRRSSTATIDIRRSERFQHLHEHFAKRIANGTTRNLVLRNCSPTHTETSIRKDLDHIHGLEIVSIKFRSGMCHISTNSVASAIKYKGSRLEWDVDECAQPLNQVPARPRRRAPFPTAPIRRSVYMSNRFQLLEAEE
ncbi:hypothetical protein TrVFT333_005930 [Trichoderma virens FT-333]|nr:hypothetical protein TrVFT333_005930 [Trichoderma virens FT-333]